VAVYEEREQWELSYVPCPKQDVQRRNHSNVDVDDLWVNTGHTIQNEFKDRTTFLIGLSNCKLKGCYDMLKLCFCAEKDISDVYDDMDGDCYEKNFVVPLSASTGNRCRMHLCRQRRHITPHIPFEEKMLKEN
jgi:hypothetical protein